MTDDTPTRLVVEVSRAGGALRGCVRGVGGERVEFDGWLQLITALQRAVADQAQEPDDG